MPEKTNTQESRRLKVSTAASFYFVWAVLNSGVEKCTRNGFWIFLKFFDIRFSQGEIWGLWENSLS